MPNPVPLALPHELKIFNLASLNTTVNAALGVKAVKKSTG